MTTLEKIQQDLKTLPPEALDLVDEFVQLLKKAFPTSPASKRQ